MKKISFICKGTCGAKITKEQYDKGLVVCGAKECTMKGKPFKKVN